MWTAKVSVSRKGQKKTKKRANNALNIQSSIEEDVRTQPLTQKKRTSENSTSTPEGQQDKRPAKEGQPEDNWGQWLKASTRGTNRGQLARVAKGQQ